MGEKYCWNSSYLWSYSHHSTILWLTRHWISVTRNRNWCRWTNIHPEKYQRLYGTFISILYKMQVNIVGILHIYGDRSIFLLFCYHQDTKSESYEIEMSISQPIFTNKNISKALWGNDIHTIQYGRKILWGVFIFMDLVPFS